MNRKPPNAKEAAKRAALNALRRAKRAADKAGVELSEWEGEGGAPSHERKPKHPRDPNQLAKSIIDIATGQKARPRPYARRTGQGPGCGGFGQEGRETVRR